MSELIGGILLGIILMKVYLYLKTKNKISGAKINDIIITKNNKVGILIDYRRNFECPDVADDVVYEIRDICTGTIQIVNKNMICQIVNASVGDWIITGVNGEQYPCKPDMFAKTYIKCGQANKIEQIAAMFGKKLGEEFTVKYQTPKHKYVIQYHVSFEEKGLIVYGQNKDTILRQLLTGQAMIVNE